MGETCSTCQWWEQYRDDAGMCKSLSVSQHWDDRYWITRNEAMIDTSPGQPSRCSFITGPEFSCCHYKFKEKLDVLPEPSQ